MVIWLWMNGDEQGLAMKPRYDHPMTFLLEIIWIVILFNSQLIVLIIYIYCNIEWIGTIVCILSWYIKIHFSTSNITSINSTICWQWKSFPTIFIGIIGPNLSSNYKFRCILITRLQLSYFVYKGNIGNCIRIVQRKVTILKSPLPF